MPYTIRTQYQAKTQPVFVPSVVVVPSFGWFASLSMPVMRPLWTTKHYSLAWNEFTPPAPPTAPPVSSWYEPLSQPNPTRLGLSVTNQLAFVYGGVPIPNPAPPSQTAPTGGPGDRNISREKWLAWSAGKARRDKVDFKAKRDAAAERLRRFQQDDAEKTR